MDVNLICHDIAFIQFRNISNGIYNQLIQNFPSYISNTVNRNPDVGEPVSIAFVPDLALPDGARYISSNAAYTDLSYYLLDYKGHMIHIDLSNLDGAYRFEISQHIDWGLLEDFVEILLHTLALSRHKAFFHSGGVGVDGQAVVLCGWANIGKTELIVEFLRRGYAYIGDDWTIIGADAIVQSYDKAIAMYPHDIAVSPEIAEAYYGKLKGGIISRYCQLYRPGKVEHVALRLRERIVRRILRELVYRMRLHMSIHVKAEQITCEGTILSAPLKVLYFMTRANVPVIDIAPLQADALIEQMLHCYRYETRLFFDSERFKFAFPSHDFDLGLGIRIENVKSVWSKAFSHPQVKLFTVQIPTTTGPNEMVSHLETHMHQFCA